MTLTHATQHDTLVNLANRIGQFFESQPDHDEALEGIASHIHKFWEPRMRRGLLGHLDDGGEGLLPLVREAIEKHRAALTPAA
jgi:formate dehydrogenase subunit delta